MGNIRNTQSYVNVAYSVPPDQIGIRVTQAFVNVVYTPVQPTRVTQTFINVAYNQGIDEPRSLIPEWPVKEQWMWKTSLHKGYSGTEQRMALRTEPWQVTSYSLPLLSDQDRMLFIRRLQFSLGSRFNYPLWQYYTQVTVAASETDTQLYFDPTATNIRAGEKIAVFDSTLSVFALFTIATVESDGCTINDEGGLSFDVPTTYYVAPAPSVRVDDGASWSMNRFYGKAGMMLTADAARDLLRPDQSESINTYDGYPVLDEPYLTGQGVKEDFNYGLITHRNNLGNAKDSPGWVRPQIKQQRKYRVLRENLDYWRQFFDTVAGGREAFLIPSYRSDFTLSSTPSLGATFLETTDDYVEQFFNARGYDYIKITSTNGDVYRKVTDVIPQGDGTINLLLNTALGVTAGDNDISNISFMPLSRLDGDMVEVQFFLNHLEVSFTVASVDE